MFNLMFIEFLIALGQTFYMVLVSGIIATAVGLPLGVILVTTKKHAFLENKLINSVIGAIINAGRSIPFIILLIAIIPFTRLIVGTSIGTSAAIVPLTIGAIPFAARIVENSMDEVSAGLIEAGLAMGATPMQIILKILIAEAFPGIIKGITVVIVSLVGYSAMAGAIGGGGLGDLAIRYGYQRFDWQIMIATIIILIAVVQILQWMGDWLAKKASVRR